MEKYGVTLREIRLQKGYTMKQLAEGVLSVSFLSKFERGESDISLDYFVQLLERLAVSWDEFFYMHQGYELENVETFFNEAESAYTERDFTALQAMRKAEWQKWQESSVDTYLCNTLMFDVYESILKNEEIESDLHALETLHNYLFQVESWGYYELRLYNATMLLMPPEMVIVLSRTAYEKSTRYAGLEKLKQVLIRILMNTLIYLTGGRGAFRYKEEAGQFFAYLEEVGVPEHDLYLKNQSIHIKGIYEIRSGNKEKGIQMVKQATQIFTQLGAHRLAEEVENYLAIVLKKPGV